MKAHQLAKILGDADADADVFVEMKSGYVHQIETVRVEFDPGTADEDKDIHPIVVIKPERNP
jgi:hypothetical protein